MAGKIDPEFAKQVAANDQDWAAMIEELKWAFSTSETAGQVLGRSVADAMTLLARQCDNAQYLLCFIQRGLFLALEQINEQPEE